MRKETSGNSRKFPEVSKIVFSGQSEKPHILRSGFNVPRTLLVIVRGSFERPVVVLLTIIYIYVVCTEYQQLPVVCMCGWVQFLGPRGTGRPNTYQ